jgi:hypothetical protein
LAYSVSGELILNLGVLERLVGNMKKLLNGYTIARSTLRPSPKREFNPADQTDLAEYRHYLKNGGWKASCPFELRWPYTSVPHMIAEQISEYYIFKVAPKLK